MSDETQTNMFDELGGDFDPQAAIDEQSQQQSRYNQRDYLIHRVFKQNESGAELLAMWVKDALIMAPTARAGDELLAIGLEEGKKEFIRKILMTIEKVEGEQ
jgi:hypothetical protein